jgi:hypothetical protein
MSYLAKYEGTFLYGDGRKVVYAVEPSTKPQFQYIGGGRYIACKPMKRHVAIAIVEAFLQSGSSIHGAHCITMWVIIHWCYAKLRRFRIEQNCIFLLKDNDANSPPL